MNSIIYEPNKYAKLGFKIWPAMFKDIYRSRELVWRLFLRNWLAKYKQAVLGCLWALIIPFIAIGTFIFLNRAGVLNISETAVAYPLFALIGLTVWQLFSTGVTSGTQSLVTSGSMIAKINFPHEVLVVAAMAQSIFEFMIKLILVVIFFAVYRFCPPWQAVLFPLALVPILLLTLGLSFLLALINGVLRDVANMVSLVVTFLMFATPVLYPAKSSGNIFFKWNPLNYLVNTPRDLIVQGRIVDMEGFILSSVFALGVFLLSWRIFYIAKTKIPERI